MKKNILLTLAVILLGTINLFGMEEGEDGNVYYAWDEKEEAPGQRKKGAKEKEEFSWEEEKSCCMIQLCFMIQVLANLLSLSCKIKQMNLQY